MKSDGQRGHEGKWLMGARKARGYSNAHKAVAALKEMTGHVIHYSAWASYESGGRPIGDQHEEWLVEFFGPIPDLETPANDADMVAAIKAQTAVLAEIRDILSGIRPEGELLDAVLAERSRRAGG